MEQATLGGVPGAGEAVLRRRGPTSSAHRGTFWFKAEHQGEMVRLFDMRAPIEFEGLVDGQRRKIKTTLTSLSVEIGVAFLEGSGEPY